MKKLFRISTLMAILVTAIILGFDLPLWGRILTLVLHVAGWATVVVTSWVDASNREYDLRDELTSQQTTCDALVRACDGLTEELTKLQQATRQRHETFEWLALLLEDLRLEILARNKDRLFPLSPEQSSVEMAIILLHLSNPQGRDRYMSKWSEQHPWHDFSGGMHGLVMQEWLPLDYGTARWVKAFRNDQVTQTWGQSPIASS